MHGTALLALYCLFLIWRATDKRAVFFRLLLAGVLGLLLTAFYWLPALAENDAIKLPLIAEQLSHIDVKRHLRPLSEIIALPQTADPTQQNQNLPISVGWVQLVFAGIGTLLSCRAPHRRLPLAYAGALVRCRFLDLPQYAALRLALGEYPLDRLYAVSLAHAGIGKLAVSVDDRGWRYGCSGESLGGGRRGVALVGGMTLLLVLYALPWTYTLYHDDVALDDIRDLQRFERESGQLALSSYAEYLPVSADARHLDPQRLSGSIRRRTMSYRAYFPRIRWRSWSRNGGGPQRNRGWIRRGAQTLVFDWLYVPGWAAIIDGTYGGGFPLDACGLGRA